VTVIVLVGLALLGIYVISSLATITSPEVPLSPDTSGDSGGDMAATDEAAADIPVSAAAALVNLFQGSVALTTTDKVQAIAQAIAKAEGFGPSGAIPTKCNNPGDLCLGDFGLGTITSSGGEKITVFSSVQDGWNHLYSQIQMWINGTSKYINPQMTWAQIGMKYAGAPIWAINVARNLGVDVNSTLADYLTAEA
jgi:hypothetical protein